MIHSPQSLVNSQEKGVVMKASPVVWAMMVRWLLPIFAVLLLTLSSLTVVQAPTLFFWKLAILAEEFGQFLIVLPLALGLGAIFGGTPGPLRWMTLGLCAIAAGLFLRPTFQARRLADDLPRRLERAFGAENIGGEPLSFRQLFLLGSSTAGVVVETRVFANRATEEELALDVYRSEGRAQSPCVVVIHGGGWDSGDRTQLTAFNYEFARRGFTVAAISYRLAPRTTWPAQPQDVRSALDYLRTHATELGVDPHRFVLFGRSAGGQLAEAVGYDQPDPSIRGVIAWYAPADLNFAWFHTREADLLDSFKLMRQYTGGTPETAKANFDDASPYLKVKKGTLPTLLAHGGLDGLVWHRQSERLAERLAEVNTPCVFLDLPWATHAFDFNPHGPSGQLSSYAIEWFLRAVTH
jgi:acetyl esterase/lipase